MRHTGVLTALLPLAVHATFPLSKQHPLIARVNQPYSWSISPLTFDNANSSATLLRTSPDWLVYDNATSTFRGTPTSEDIGVTTVRIRNQFGESDHFQLCVSDHPSPIVNIPLASQLVPGNPSISSGFTFSAPNIGVRVPPKWSFSIGFDGFTFTSPDERNVYYDATLADGLPLPGWVVFNNRSLTFDGVAPPTNHNPKLSIMLHGSDRWGFGATHEQFDLIIGPRTHLVGVDGTGGLETVNVTAGIPFIHSIKTFGGLVIDGVPLVAANISRVEVNVSAVSWATFNSSTRMLSGFPPVSAIGQPDFVFPVSITSDYNDTVDTNISVAVFPSYFTATPIQPMTVTLGSFAMFSLREYFSRARSSSATIVPEYVPRAAASWLNYDNSSGTLRGLVPRSATYNEVNVTFYATDVETHAMSTTSLLLSISSNETYGPEVWGHRHGPDVSQRAKTVIIVIFTVLGGAILLCCLLAICRCYCGVREPREDDEKSSQWKGRDIISPGAQHIGFSKEMMRSAGSSRASDDTVVTFGDGFKLPVSVVLPPQSSSPDPGHRPTSMKRVHFFQRLLTPSKRKLGDQSLGSQSGKIRRSQISRPTLISDGGTLERMQIIVSENGPRLDTEKNPSQHGEQHALGSSAVLNSIPSFGWPRVGPTAQGLPFEGSTHVKIDRSSQVLSESDESSLTSIPRRRSDFLPPRGQQMGAPEQLCDNNDLHCIPCSGSSGTINSELREAAIIATAARQVLPSAVSTTSVDHSIVRSSVDSANSTTPSKGRSSPSSPASVSITGVRRPRLVQLNSERRVPATPNEGPGTVRNVSQKAVISSSSRTSAKSGESRETDQDRRLSLGIRYVSALGEGTDDESAIFYMTPSVGKAASPLVGAGKSLALHTAEMPGNHSPSATSLNQGSEDGALLSTSARQLKLPVGTPFTIPVPFETIPARGAELLVRQQNGKPIPAWINLDQRDVEIWGVPMRDHRGIHLLEIVENTQLGQRVVSRMSLEVVE